MQSTMQLRILEAQQNQTILNSYDASFTTSLIIAEEKQMKSSVEMHFVYLPRTNTISLQNMPRPVKGTT
jgi:hypothetical protein